MDITEVSVIHHVGIVLALLWFLSSFNWCHPIAYFVSLIYLYQVNEQYITRMRRKLQFDERKQANQKRVLSDSETVRWLNYAVDKIWSICMEEIVSQKILLPIIPWFLEKYKPWTAKEAVVQHLYMGRNPPVFTDMRVVRQFNNDDHLVLELGMNFLTADDMLAILSVKLRKRLGFGMRPKLHITGMHIEGKVLVGVKFLRRWPFLGRLRVCFAEPPYFQMTVKPIFTHGLDVTELPGIAGWLDKLLSVAFEQTLVEPNMLVVDMEKFASPQPESWFSMDVKEPIAFAKVEVVEASNMKPSDLNGLADPYVKGHLGPYRFRTKTQKKTLAPKWNEEFKIPICQWDSPNLLVIEVRDKDHFVDDTLGDCTINLNDLRDGQRHDMWLPLQNVKVGRLHLAITVLEDNVKGDDHPLDGETLNKEDLRNSFASETAHKGSFSYVSSEKSQKVADSFEPINIEGQRETGIWVHHPGSHVSQIWEPRKGKSRCLDTKIQSEANDSIGSFNSVASGSYQNDSSSADENPEGKKPTNAVWRGLKKIGSTFHRSPKKDEQSSSIGEAAVLSPHVNIRPVNARNIGVKFVIEDVLTEKKENDLSGLHVKIQNAEGSSSAEGSGQDSPSKGNMKGMAKSILKHAGNSARGIKHALSRKSSRRCRGGDSGLVQPERELLVQSDPSDDESLPFAVHSPEVERILIGSNDPNSKVDNSWTVSSESVMNTEDPVKNEKPDGPERIADEKAGNSEGHDDELVEESSNPKLSVGNLEEEREGEGQRGRNLG